MQRILIIGEDPTVSVRMSPQLQTCPIEIAEGNAEALQRLRQRAFELVLTNPQSSVQEDLALVNEIENIRPGVKTIILAPEATPEDVIASLRARVFACFSSPFDVNEVAAMMSKALEASNWRSAIEVLSAEPNWIALRVNCQLLTADRLLRFMTEFRSDLADPDRSTLLTAFREILLNCMEHGAGFDSEKVIEVNAVRTKRAIVFRFRDPGPGFRGKPLPHAAINNPPDNPVAHLEFREAQGLRPGGFGILLAQQLVDELVFNEMGNEVLLIKHTA
jgi:anti-sigma regulatory factor (Ser/Thr protein kinase)/ActR/RegA family two-component response regulator